jgi:hypothetical protein
MRVPFDVIEEGGGACRMAEPQISVREFSSMPVEKFISTAKLDEYIRSEMEERLATNEICKLDSYGWLDEDTPDPDFLGHSERRARKR